MADDMILADERRGPVIGAVHDFVEGLVKTSTHSLLIALAVCAACLVSFVTLLNERTMATMDPGYLASKPTDHFVYSTSALLRLQQNHSDKFLLVIIGASVTRSTYGTTAEIRDQFRERFGIDADVVNLTTSPQSLWEHYALLRELPRDRPVLAIVGTGPGRFTADQALMQELVSAPRIGVRLPGLDDQARKMGVEPTSTTGIYAIDNQNFLLARWQYLLLHAFTGPIEHNETQYRAKTQDPKRVKSVFAKVLKRLQSAYAPNLAANLGVLDDMVKEDDRRPAMKVVFVEHLVNPYFIETHLGPATYQRHLDTMAQWQKTSGATYVNIKPSIALTPNDFADWAHIKSPKVPEQMRAALFDEVAPFVTELEARSGK